MKLSTSAELQRELRPTFIGCGKFGIAELQKHIGNYGKTREVYRQYRALPPKKRERFFEEHRMEITLHRAAKEHFDSLGLQKFPSMDSLRKEYATKRHPHQI